jgi:hypothetical protein
MSLFVMKKGECLLSLVHKLSKFKDKVKKCENWLFFCKFDVSAPTPYFNGDFTLTFLTFWIYPLNFENQAAVCHNFVTPLSLHGLKEKRDPHENSLYVLLAEMEYVQFN